MLALYSKKNTIADRHGILGDVTSYRKTCVKLNKDFLYKEKTIQIHDFHCMCSYYGDTVRAFFRLQTSSVSVVV